MHGAWKCNLPTFLGNHDRSTDRPTIYQTTNNQQTDIIIHWKVKLPITLVCCNTRRMTWRCGRLDETDGRTWDGFFWM